MSGPEPADGGLASGTGRGRRLPDRMVRDLSEIFVFNAQAGHWQADAAPKDVLFSFHCLDNLAAYLDDMVDGPFRRSERPVSGNDRGDTFSIDSAWTDGQQWG